MTRFRTTGALVASVLLVVTSVSASQGAARGAPPAAPRYQLQVLAHVDPGGGSSADVSGHRGFAYLSSYRGSGCPAQGVRVYDVRNPRTPRLVSTFADKESDPSLVGTDTEKTIVKSVDTPGFKGDLAVTGIQACRSGVFQGFGIYDVTNPAQPKKLALFRTEPAGLHELWLQMRGRRAYVYAAIPFSELLTAPDLDAKTHDATTPGEPDFRIYDVSNPQRPVKVGEWGAWKALGLYPRSGIGIGKSTFAHSVITNPAATRAYVSYWDAATVILDISNPARPRFLGRTTFGATQTEGDAHSAALAKNGKILIETHESPRANFPAIYDISNARRPRHLADFRLPASIPATDQTVFGGVHDPKVQGNRAFFSWYGQGVIVADISTPRKPRLLTQFLTSPSPRVWGVYPEKSYLLASDMNSGLWILRLRKATG